MFTIIYGITNSKSMTVFANHKCKNLPCLEGGLKLLTAMTCVF